MNFNASNTNFDASGAAPPIDFRAFLAALTSAPQQQQQQPPGQIQHPLSQSSSSLPSAVPQWPVQAQIGQYQWQQPQAQPSAAAFQAPLPQLAAPQLQPNGPLNQAQYNVVAQWAAQNQIGPQSAPQMPVAATQPQPHSVQNTDLNAVTASFLSAFNTYLTQQQQQQSSQAPPAAAPQAAQQSATQMQRQHTPVGSAPDDESRLIAALRNCRSLNMTYRQAMEGLDGVNGHSAIAWKDYFLDHIHRLYRQSNPQGPKEPTDGGRQPVPQAARERYSAGIPLEQTHPSYPRMSKEARPTLARPNTNATSESSTMTPPEFARRSPTPPGDPPLGTRRRRGSPVAMYHAGTRIPPRSQRMSVKPTPPTWEKNDGSKFTDADKTFFIHYLQWRMQSDPLITKPELYDELAEYAPHHDADAWKRHWDKHPQLPDKLYIEGRNRAYLPTQSSGSKTAGVPRRTQAGAASGEDSDSELPSNGDGDEDAHAPEKQATDSAPQAASSARKGRGRSRKTWQPVTEADLRAMATYMLERQSMWSESGVNRTKRWTEFAERKENAARRSLLAWMAIENTHANRLQAHLAELRKAAATEVQTSDTPKGDASATPVPSQPKPPRVPSPFKELIQAPMEKTIDGARASAEKQGSTARETTSVITTKTRGVPLPRTAERDTGKAEIPVDGLSAVAQAGAFSGSLKRHADEDTKSGSPVHKRPKEGPQEGIHEVIELSD